MKQTRLRWPAVGSLSAAGIAGKNKAKFDGRLRGTPGNYLAIATDSAGGRSLEQTAGFRILGG